MTTVDVDGNIATDSAIVNVAKVTIITHPSNPSKKEEVNFGVEVIGFTPSKYTWDFGDGSIGFGQSVTHKYSSSKKYYGKLSFEKSDSILEDFVISVSEIFNSDSRKPTSHFSVSPLSGDTSTLFEFDASSSYDSNGKIVTYEWYFGDGNMIITKNPKCNYAFEKEGQWEVKCISLSNDGGFDTSFRTIEVTSGAVPLSNIQLSSQEGMLFFNGKLDEVKAEISSTEDSLAIIEAKPCDLEISVNINTDTLQSEDSVAIEIIVSDSLDNYDEDEVDIQLLSDIPGYEIVSYSAVSYTHLTLPTN